MPFGWEILFIFCRFVPLCSTYAWRLAIVCVKFCNNIKRRYERVNNNLFSMSFLPSFVCSTQWMIASVSFPASVQTHRYFWQAFDVALWWAVPLQWPLNGVNTPFTVQIKAAAHCFSEYLIAHRFARTALLLWEHRWPTGPDLKFEQFRQSCEVWRELSHKSLCVKTYLLLVSEYSLTFRTLCWWSLYDWLDVSCKFPATGRSQSQLKTHTVSFNSSNEKERKLICTVLHTGVSRGISNI